MIITPNAILVRPEQLHGRSRAETHAVAFLARYRVPQTRASYALSLRRWFGWCATLQIDPLEATRAQIEIFATELEATGRSLATVASQAQRPGRLLPLRRHRRASQSSVHVLALATFA
jgi:hypothetical protein